MNLAFKPYQLVFLFALILLAASFFSAPHTLDLHFHDTYYVIDHFTVLQVFAIFLLVTGILCELTHKLFYSRLIDHLHIILTITGVLLVIGTMYYYAYLLNAPVTGNRPDIRLFFRTERVLLFSLLFLAAAQVLFLSIFLPG